MGGQSTHAFLLFIHNVSSPRPPSHTGATARRFYLKRSAVQIGLSAAAVHGAILADAVGSSSSRSGIDQQQQEEEVQQAEEEETRGAQEEVQQLNEEQQQQEEEVQQAEGEETRGAQEEVQQLNEEQQQQEEEVQQAEEEVQQAEQQQQEEEERPKKKRRRMRWTKEELLWVKGYFKNECTSSSPHVSNKWVKITKAGKGVLHPHRTPMNVKDAYRSMQQGAYVRSFGIEPI